VKAPRNLPTIRRSYSGQESNRKQNMKTIKSIALMRCLPARPQSRLSLQDHEHMHGSEAPLLSDRTR